MKISGFMHVAQIGNWRRVFQEQADLVRSTGLAAKCDRICVGVLGEEAMDLAPPFCLQYQSPNLLFFEYETLKHLWQHSKYNEGSVWYIHTKGVSKTQEEWDRHEPFYRDLLGLDSLDRLQRHEEEWRKYMEHFVVRKHNECLKALEEHDVVGVSWRERSAPHFSGNFWWARTSYVKALQDPYDLSDMKDIVGDYRGGAECWIGSGTPSVKSLCNLDHNFYRWGVPKIAYIPFHL